MVETSATLAPVEEKAPAKVDSPTKPAKKPASKVTHPSAAEMVTSAIKTLGERGGSSVQAIKKYIAATYMVDVDKQAPFIKKFLKSAVTKEILIQTKGKGASGSFKLAATKASKPKVAGDKKAAKKPAAKKPATKKPPGEAKAAKSPASPKKAAVKKPSSPKKPAAKSPAKPKATASPKAKKATKVPTAKPKSPKPKKTATKVAKSPAKKTAAIN
ncbi:histone H1 [Microplitis demolitor]|uniref:histone H1 n=1 Tax=Microplitis demolitor TaxID=69319 RepID=UPI0006D50644|nr:histone H1 [Microplitis demolitor]